MLIFGLFLFGYNLSVEFGYKCFFMLIGLATDWPQIPLSWTIQMYHIFENIWTICILSEWVLFYKNMSLRLKIIIFYFFSHT